MTRGVIVPELEPMIGLRINATPAALDAAVWPPGARVMRLAPDDVFLIGDGDFELEDPHAIVDHEAGFSGTWLQVGEMAGWLEKNAMWRLAEPGRLAQGMAAHLPIKTMVEGDQVLVLTATVVAHELAERLP